MACIADEVRSVQSWCLWGPANGDDCRLIMASLFLILGVADLQYSTSTSTYMGIRVTPVEDDAFMFSWLHFT